MQAALRPVRGSGQELKPIHQILGNIENYYGGHTAFRFYTYTVETAVFYCIHTVFSAATRITTRYVLQLAIGGRGCSL